MTLKPENETLSRIKRQFETMGLLLLMRWPLDPWSQPKGGSTYDLAVIDETMPNKTSVIS